MKLLHVAVDVYEEQIRAGRYFLHERPLGASSWLDPRMTALQKTKGVFTVSSPMCRFQAKIETRNGSRDVHKFVYKPTKWVTNSKVLAEALDRRRSNISGPPSHRYIVMDGGIAKTSSANAPELVNTVLRALRQQMLADGWIAELELQVSTSRRMQPLNGRMNFMTTREHSFQVNW